MRSGPGQPRRGDRGLDGEPRTDTFVAVILVGTSGYNYPAWKGNFHPETLAASKMLPYYAGRFSTVEINYTFYRMPTAKLVAGWAAQVPRRFASRSRRPNALRTIAN